MMSQDKIILELRRIRKEINEKITGDKMCHISHLVTPLFNLERDILEQY